MTEEIYVECLILYGPLTGFSFENRSMDSNFFLSFPIEYGVLEFHTSLSILQATCRLVQIRPSVVPNRFHSKPE